MTIDLASIYLAAFGAFAVTGLSEELEESVSGGAVTIENMRSNFEAFVLRRESVELRFGFPGMINHDDGIFAPPPLVNFEFDKTIEETQMSSIDNNGNELEFGQVIEVYGTKPTNIEMRGIIIDMKNGRYPGDKLKLLRQAFEWHGAWEIEGQIYRDMGIRSVYMLPPLRMEMVEGYESTWSWSVTMRSLRPAEYFLKKKTIA